MIGFSISEILLSVAYAAIYGAGFFVFFCILNIFISEGYRIKLYAKGVLSYDKILQNTAKKQGRDIFMRNSLVDFLLTLAFFVGFIFLSYYALDGCFRVYMLLLSVGVFFICYGLVFSRLFSLLCSIIDFLFYIGMLMVRLLIFPFRWAVFNFLIQKKRK